jgi:hypothetical protein
LFFFRLEGEAYDVSVARQKAAGRFRKGFSQNSMRNAADSAEHL